MAEIKEVISSIKEILITPMKDSIEFRAKNAFFGSFVISWVVWNWENIFYFILSKDDVLYKISMIKSSLPVKCESITSFPYSYFVIPFIFSFILTLIYPGLMLLMLWAHQGLFEIIDSSINKSNTKKITKRKELTEAEEENEGVKASTQARIGLRIALMRQEEAKRNSSVDLLWKKESDLNASIYKLESDKKQLELLIGSLSNESVKLGNDLSEIKKDNKNIIELNNKYDIKSKELAEKTIESETLYKKTVQLNEMVRDLESRTSSMSNGTRTLTKIRENLDKLDTLIQERNGKYDDEELQDLLKLCRTTIIASRSDH